MRALSAFAGKDGKFTVSIAPRVSDPDEVHWIELLAHGLTFDLSGLAPGPAHRVPDCDHRYGLPADFDPAGCAAISLTPGPHLASGGPMLPVIRCLAWLAAQLAALPGMRAVGWSAAGTCSSPAHFRDGVMNWVGGGVFPGLGLTALDANADGGLESRGLALFTGQELRLAPDLAGDRADAAKLAVRLLHWLVESGKIDQSTELTGPSGETLRLEPRDEGAIVEVWRS